MTDLSKAQMTKVAESLTAAGFTVELECTETEGPCEWNETTQDWDGPVFYTITWGEWEIYDSGEFQCGRDAFQVNDCDFAGFVQAAHKAWHDAGGATFRVSEVAA